jgi:hypothetical protein
MALNDSRSWKTVGAVIQFSHFRSHPQIFKDRHRRDPTEVVTTAPEARSSGTIMVEG